MPTKPVVLAEGGSASGGSGRRTTSSSELLPTFKKPAVTETPAAQPAVVSTSPSIVAKQKATLSLPQSLIGVPVPYVCGTARIAAPNILWYGNEDTDTVVTYVLGPNGLPTYTTRDLSTLDIQFGLCTGPGVRLRGLFSGDEVIWTGTKGPNREQFAIGGTSGLYIGNAIFYGGEFDQTPEPLLETALAGSYPPGYVGIAYLILEGADQSGDFNGFSFEVDRFPNPLSLASNINVSSSGKDINLMTLLVDVLTSEWNGAGIDISSFNTTALTSVATTLASEGNFGSCAIQDESLSADQIITMIEAQADGVCFTNPTTGLIEFRLFRPDSVNLEDTSLIQLDTSNILRAPEWDKGSWDGGIDQVRVEFTDRDDSYSTQTATAQTIAVTAAGGRSVKSRSVRFPLCCDKSLANDLAGRELGFGSVPRFGVRIETNRVSANTLPGDVVIVTYENYQLDGTPLYVLRRKELSKKSNRVLLECSQFSFANPNAVFVDPEEPEFDPLDVTPLAPAEVKIMDMPYAFAHQFLFFNRVSHTAYDDVAYPLILARAVNRTQARFVARFDDSYDASSPKVVLQTDGYYCVTGTLQSSILAEDAITTGILSTVVVEGILQSILGPNLSPFSTKKDNVSLGRVYVFLNDEILSYESAVLAGTTLTMTNVHRALYDTVAKDHSANDDVYIVFVPSMDLNALYRGIMKPFDLGAVYSPAPTFNFKGRAWSSSNFTSESADTLTDGSWTPGERFANPLRPHDTKINGAARNTTPDLTQGDSATITWRNRSRWDMPSVIIDGGTGHPLYPSLVVGEVLSAARVRSQLDDSQQLEYDIEGSSYVKHRVMLKDSTNTTYDCGSTTGNSLTEASKTITVPMGAATGLGVLWVESYNSYGDSSRFKDLLAVNIISP